MLIGLRSRKHIAPFDLVRPASIDACLSFMSQGQSVGLMAGGLDLIDRMKFGNAFETVVSLTDIPELKGIREDDGTIIVGALTTHAALSQDPLIAEKLPDLARIWREIANQRVRHTGTVGGNLMCHLPHYDAMPSLIALGATATIADPAGGFRRISLSELPGSQALLVNVMIPDSGARLVADRSLHPSVSVYAAAASLSGTIMELRVAFGCAYSHARVVALPTQDLTQASLGARVAELAEMATHALPEPLSDGFASAGYRRRMMGVLTRRVLVRLGRLV